MITVHPKESRGKTRIDWLESWHSFSFGDYYDPANMGFGPLRVINEDIVNPAAGFHTHGHKNMEIITYVLSGALEHKDSLGNGSLIRPGGVQVMSAGKGILHSEFNPSPADPVHLLQIWIMPNETGTRPGYQQKEFDRALFKNSLKKIVSGTDDGDALTIRQNADLFAAHLDDGRDVSFSTIPARKYWVQVAQGNATVAGNELSAGDAASLENENGNVIIKATAGPTEILVFDLPA